MLEMIFRLIFINVSPLNAENPADFPIVLVDDHVSTFIDCVILSGCNERLFQQLFRVIENDESYVLGEPFTEKILCYVNLLETLWSLN